MSLVLANIDADFRIVLKRQLGSTVCYCFTIGLLFYDLDFSIFKNIKNIKNIKNNHIVFNVFNVFNVFKGAWKPQIVKQ